MKNNEDFTSFSTINLIKFWSQNSYEHIDVLLNGYESTGAVLYDSFKNELKKLFNKFKNIYKDSHNIQTPTEIHSLLRSFLAYNVRLIKILERLKFEGFNGYPALYQTVHHFIYEQKYVTEIFRSIYFNYTINPDSVLITSDFKDSGLGLTPVEYIYNQIYFWSLIGSQHPNIIATVSPVEEQLSKDVKSMLLDITNKFNNINYKLSNIYDDLTLKNLYPIYIEFNNLNKTFLNLLMDFNSKNSTYLPKHIKSKLPALFFGILTHLIDEHEYILTLLKSFDEFM